MSAVVGFTFGLISMSAISGILPKDDFLDNATITTSIKLKQAKDRLISPTKVKIVTDKHVAKLIGTIGSETQYVRAMRLAAETRGVNSVDVSKLKLSKQVSPHEDKVIQYWAKIKMQQHNSLPTKYKINVSDIQVEARNRNLYITGYVPTFQHKKTVIKTLSSIPNTKRIFTDIIVTG